MLAEDQIQTVFRHVIEFLNGNSQILVNVGRLELLWVAISRGRITALKGFVKVENAVFPFAMYYDEDPDGLVFDIPDVLRVRFEDSTVKDFLKELEAEENE